MIKFGQLIAKHRVLILILALLLLIPSIFGYAATRVNYDVLTYLPEEIDTMVGQDILMDQFGKGGFAMIVVKGAEDKTVSGLREDISQVDGVAEAIWYDSVASLTVPKDLLPDTLLEQFQQGDDTLLLAFFEEGTSSDRTLEAVKEIRAITGKQALVGGMSAIIADTRDLCEKEEAIYVLIAVALSCVVLAITLESLLLPLLFLVSIGMAILYNLGTCYFMGEISYITKALAAVLQLGVTMDYSIFLWHSFSEELKRQPDAESAMAHAIAATFSSVAGSSLTTIAGFIALCFMSFTLGLDLGLVMAKGVVLGVLACMTILPSLILIFHKAIVKTTHRPLLPDIGKLGGWVTRHYKLFLALFLILLVPAIHGYRSTGVYYNLDSSLPEDLGSVQANRALQDEFHLGTIHMLLLNKDMEAPQIHAMAQELEQTDGVSYVLGLDSMLGSRVPADFLPDGLTGKLQSDQYKLLLIGTEYPVASDAVNAQIEQLQAIAKSYDDGAMLIGEGPCTKDLITITDHDFAVVSTVSILLVFLIIAIVLRGVLLPVLLVAVIEFAIFINMGIPAYTGTVLPFIASIVIGTIQLGATVDYAILMTNRYLRERTAGKDRKQAVQTALSASANSILVSALSFFAATFGVGIYSEVDLISALCSLMARGALISMAVVLLVLPSTLYVFDRPILATTRGARKAMAAAKSNEEVSI